MEKLGHKPKSPVNVGKEPTGESEQVTLPVIRQGNSGFRQSTNPTGKDLWINMERSIDEEGGRRMLTLTLGRPIQLPFSPHVGTASRTFHTVHL